MLIKQFNYLIKIEYDGSKFVGWQHQTNGNSIQDNIEKVLSKLLKEKIKVIGAGRTDKGVHAKGQFANFKTQKEILEEKKTFKFFKLFSQIELNFNIIY